MFVFGDPSTIADLYIESARRVEGPDLPDVPFEELNELQQKAEFTYIYMAYKAALRDGVEGERLDAIMRVYDLTFHKLAKAQDGFVQAVNGNRHVFLPDWSEETVSKYRMLAGLEPRR